MDFKTLHLDAVLMGLVPVISEALEHSHADEWIYNHLPADIKAKGTLEEFDAVVAKGKELVKAWHDFTS